MNIMQLGKCFLKIVWNGAKNGTHLHVQYIHIWNPNMCGSFFKPPTSSCFKTDLIVDIISYEPQIPDGMERGASRWKECLSAYVLRLRS